MRVLVCGGRDYNNADYMRKVLDDMHAVTPFDILIYGMARGADDLAKMWATARGIERLGFPANWERFGRSAGHIRNKEMLDKGKPDLVIAFPGGRGTQNMIKQARAANVSVCALDS